MVEWHKKYYKWFQKKTGMSGYAMAWFAFIKGLILRLLIALWIN